MRLAVPAEPSPQETRVSLPPDGVAALVKDGWEVTVQAGAGAKAGFGDDLYQQAGAAIAPDAASVFQQADVVCMIGPPSPGYVSRLSAGTLLFSLLDPFVSPDLVAHLASGGITAFSLEAIPRTTLAQSMDVLSSQATAGGYAAVLLAASESPRFFPMLVTAAGTIPPSKLLVLGVGVAGLQAIATGRRLGAQVSAYDIRPETKEQVESLGARFVAAPTEKGEESGYAKEVSADTQQQQHAALAPHIAAADIVITTAQIPGRQAPMLVTTAMVEAMKPGSVIVDMAAGSGGNVEPSRPDETVEVDGVRILGPTNLAASVAADASRMFGRNLLNLIKHMSSDDGSIRVDLGDEIVGGCCITKNGSIVHPRLRPGAAEEA
jgi:NAD(P) transhydrogenase subunit alpha